MGKVRPVPAVGIVAGCALPADPSFRFVEVHGDEEVLGVALGADLPGLFLLHQVGVRGAMGHVAGFTSTHGHRAVDIFAPGEFVALETEPCQGEDEPWSTREGADSAFGVPFLPG